MAEVETPTLVLIEWQDAYTEDGWVGERRARRAPPRNKHLTRSVGWLVAENEHSVVLAADTDGAVFNRRIVLPRGMVLRTRKLDIPDA
jgi:hypothetical protein